MLASADPVARPTAKGDPIDERSTLTWLTPALLIAIVALAAGLRLWGLTWSLPWPLHPDEHNPVDQARAMVTTIDLTPEYFRNPAPFTFLTLVVPGRQVHPRVHAVREPARYERPGPTIRTYSLVPITADEIESVLSDTLDRVKVRHES